jgi:gamma-butyrobetaine dioxygenase/trimethyllysine dioxygenase
MTDHGTRAANPPSMSVRIEAHDRFAKLAAAHAMRCTLRAGDVILYDNHRMLHARTAFQGARWVRGVYFDAATR